MMSLSWVARLSISLITVLDSPSMLATSSIFLWVPCAEWKRYWSRVGLGFRWRRRMVVFWLSTLIHLTLETPALLDYSIRRFPWLDNTHPDKRSPEAKPGRPSPPWKRGLTLQLSWCTRTMRVLWSMWTHNRMSNSFTRTKRDVLRYVFSLHVPWV